MCRTVRSARNLADVSCLGRLQDICNPGSSINQTCRKDPWNQVCWRFLLYLTILTVGYIFRPLNVFSVNDPNDPRLPSENGLALMSWRELISCTSLGILDKALRLACTSEAFVHILCLDENYRFAVSTQARTESLVLQPALIVAFLVNKNWLHPLFIGRRDWPRTQGHWRLWFRWGCIHRLEHAYSW